VLANSPDEVRVVEYGGVHRYKIVYIEPFVKPGKDAKILKINGRGERI
jgi:hypothetical protein